MNAVVTGASGGIGREVCAELYRYGYNIIAQLNTGSKSSIEDVIKYDEGRLKVISADFSKRDDVLEFSKQVQALGGADILVNNAGMSVVKLMCDHTEDEIYDTILVNSAAPIYLSKLLLPGMLKKGFGSIVNVSSIWGEYGAACETVYSASKAALIGFSKALQKELEQTKVEVSCIALGFVDTKMNGHLSDAEVEEFLQSFGQSAVLSPKEAAKRICALALSSKGKIEIFK